MRIIDGYYTFDFGENPCDTCRHRDGIFVAADPCDGCNDWELYSPNSDVEVIDNET